MTIQDDTPQFCYSFEYISGNFPTTLAFIQANLKMFSSILRRHILNYSDAFVLFQVIVVGTILLPY